MLTLVVTASPATISTTMNECRLRADSQTIDATDFKRERDSMVVVVLASSRQMNAQSAFKFAFRSEGRGPEGDGAGLSL